MTPKPSFVRPAIFTNHVVMGVHGDSGIGKSRLVGTSTQIGRTLGIRGPTEHWDSMMPEDKARIEEAVISSWDEMWELQEFLRSEGGQYNWVWLDGASTLFDALLDDIWDTVITEKPARQRYGLDKSEYGINMDRLARWLRHVIGPDLFNFGFTTHSMPAQSPDLDTDGDPIEKLMPWVQGKGMPTRFAAYSKVVAFMETATIGRQEDRRVLRTRTTDRYYANDMFDAFDGRVVDPTMPKVMKLIEASPGYQSAQRRTPTPTGRPRPASQRRVVRR